MKAGNNERNESKRSSNSRSEMANLSLHQQQLDKYPRDLLQRFMSTETARQQQAQKRDKDIESQDDIELNLGLSLGGRFGVDKNKLIRSSSVAGSIPIFRDDDSNTPAPPQPYPSLVRTSSLPTETEEEWRKRKELQMLRRMEAKRRRSEKQKSSRERNEGVLLLDEEKQQNQQQIGTKATTFGLPNWLAAARQTGGSGNNGGGGDGGGLARPSSQGSGESSSMSELQQGTCFDFDL